jgi:hypothetical protein
MEKADALPMSHGGYMNSADFCEDVGTFSAFSKHL